ncbi:FAD-dependent hydroxylase [Leptolyngbya iicbica]|uniref:FAD-dependent hydroxylase n=2 Tax=Cyanophyceae TaxID=3028117 RepID=A0A4Q7EGR4_9CYAN|nr:FAD-dependent hydroxylase [Leptolyngbya sp. LK]RZM82472.1 FAD-dependent hydroxylase [Leptolyngbya sp. LK]
MPELLSTDCSQSFHSHHCDIAIVGGGVVGTTLAAALAGSGLSVLIIEAQTLEGAAARERGYALSPLSGQILDGIGVWERIFPYIGKYHDIYLSDADCPRLVKFHPQDLGTEFLGYVGEHRIMLSALQDFINSERETVQWLCPAQLQQVTYQSEAVILDVEVEGQLQQVRSRLVVGADGPQSYIRQTAGIQTWGWKYWQSCLTFMITHTAPRNDIAFERFWPDGPMGVLPLTGDRYHIVWTAPHAEAKALQNMEEDEFLAELEYYTGGFLGKLTLTSDRRVFPVQLFQSRQYVRPRVALVGDAAHRCHPVAGQGLNLGIRDAAALAQVLTTAWARGEDLGNLAVLRRYERWRKVENLAILGFTDFLDRIFSNHWWPILQIRRLGLWLLRNVPPFKVLALKFMTGFWGRRPTLAQARTKANQPSPVAHNSLL